MIVPSHVQIETVNGVCTSRCTMYTFSSWTRKKRVMPTEEFREILEKLAPHRHSIRFLTLHGCGEPLLDPTIADKIKLAKDLDYRGTGFATNSTELRETTARRLLDAGLDTIICSIDGIKKKTHESIRVGTDFDAVVSNVINFIKMRNESGQTRVMVRFIRQSANRDEWPEFHQFWRRRIEPRYGDVVVKFDIHNWADKITEYDEKQITQGDSGERLVCSDVFERLFIYSDGSVALCCADDNGFYDMGNVFHVDPVHIYNNEIFTLYRDTMLKGNLRSLMHCATCSLPRSRDRRDAE